MHHDYLGSGPGCERESNLLMKQSDVDLKEVITINRGHLTVSELELWNRILKSLIKVGCPSRFKSFLSDFLTGSKPLLLWSF